MEERKYKKESLCKMKIGYLVLILLLSVVIHFFVFFVLAQKAQNPFVVVAAILIGFFIVYPSVSFVYSKKFISNGKYRLLQSILCPMAFTFSYTCLLFTEEETYLYALVIFVWCELWSLLGLITYNKKKLAQNISVNEDITNN